MGFYYGIYFETTFAHELLEKKIFQVIARNIEWSQSNV